MPSRLDGLPCGSMSMTRTRRLSCAMQEPRLMAVVVLPTPPFWLAIVMTLPIPLRCGGGPHAHLEAVVRRRLRRWRGEQASGGQPEQVDLFHVKPGVAKPPNPTVFSCIWGQMSVRHIA